MAVYTQIDDAQLEAFLQQYEIGSALSFKGIAEGVENSNYYLETDQGRFILTLFEKRVNPADLPYFIGLKERLARTGFSCPEPIRGKDGQSLRTLAGRPAVIVSFLDGLSPKRPNAEQCRAFGVGLAEMHTALADFDLRRANDLGPTSWRQLWTGRETSAEALEPGISNLIEADLSDIEAARLSDRALPAGTIHADLFPDNAFFLGNQFSGVIDFYFACNDFLVYDIAVCLNAWAFDDSLSSSGLQYKFSHGRALLAGYQSVRSLSSAELEALPILCRGAAIRFFLTRLIDWTDTPADALVRPKDPLEYARRLEFHRRVAGPGDYGA